MIVVSDTSPITNLIIIGELDLLHQIFGKIIITPEVYLELCQLEKCKDELSNSDWIETAELSDTKLKDTLLLDLDEGEAEAIALAVELKADYLLMDEQKGRAIAEKFGVKVTGILGVLIQAKEKKLIVAVKPYIQRLTSEAGFWLNPILIKEILKLVKEA